MLELILKGTDLFMKKTGSADKLHICGNAERMLFLIIGILLVFAGAKVYRLIVSFIMFWGVTIALCTVMNGKTGWGTIVTAFTILGCLMGYMAFKWKNSRCHDPVCYDCCGSCMDVLSILVGCSYFRSRSCSCSGFFSSGGSNPFFWCSGNVSSL